MTLLSPELDKSVSCTNIMTEKKTVSEFCTYTAIIGLQHFDTTILLQQSPKASLLPWRTTSRHW